MDFEKAFDSIEWSYIENVLKWYNFGSDFLKWFQIIYNDSESCVINNGNYSSFFKLERGCRQGDPLSPYLFILCIEPLSRFIKCSNLIKGVTIGAQEYKIGHYADDTFLILDGKIESAARVMNAFQKFETISGLKLNVEKTQIIKLGNL